MHRGHQHLLAETIKNRPAGGTSCVFTFDVPPEQYFKGKYGLITSFPGKVERFFAYGIEEVAWLPFTIEFASMEAEHFVRNILVRQLNAKHIVCGFDFRFGRGRAGDCAFLKEMGASLGFTVTEVGAVQVNGEEAISSTLIRRLISDGELEQAARYLGYFPTYSGRIVHGEGRGRLLGFPTANLHIDPRMVLPPEGVYLTWCTLPDGRGVPAVASIGKNPTFSGTVQTLEVYILDFSGDLYGERLEVQFLYRQRGIHKYESAAQLQEQIEEDVRIARQLLQRFHLQDGRIVLR